MVSFLTKRTVHRSLLCALTLSMAFYSTAQENTLLARSFWKNKPSLEVVQEKVGAGNDPSALNRYAFDPLVYALLENASMPVLNYLLSQEGNTVNKLTHDGRTYIFWAAYANNLLFTKYLLSQGAKTDVIDDHGYTVLNFAASTGLQNPKLYDVLLQHDPKLLHAKNRSGANALLLLLPQLKNPEMVYYFAQKGLELKSTDTEGNNAFYYTAKGGNLEMLDFILAEGIPHNTFNTKGENAVMAAARGMRRHSNSLEVFQYLESKGLALNSTNHNGATPLLAYANSGEDAEVLSYFLARGNKPNHTDQEGNNALMLAAKNSSLAAVRLLISATKNINKANKKGETALSNAVRYNHAEVVDVLLNAGAEVNTKDTEGNTLVYYLLNTYQPEATDAFEQKLHSLQSQGINLKAPQANGNTFFHLAADLNQLPLLKKAHALGLDVNAKNDEGLTPLHLLAMKASNEMTLQYLISIGANHRSTTSFGESAYELASENEQLKNNKVDLNFLKP